MAKCERRLWLHRCRRVEGAGDSAACFRLIKQSVYNTKQVWSRIGVERNFGPIDSYGKGKLAVTEINLAHNPWGVKGFDFLFASCFRGPTSSHLGPLLYWLSSNSIRWTLLVTLRWTPSNRSTSNGLPMLLPAKSSMMDCTESW